MSLLKDINDLDLNLKSTVFGLIAIMPFWYIDIYFFANWFFDESPIQLPIIISFCLAIGWMAIGILWDMSLMDYYEIEEPKLEKVSWTVTMIFLIIFLGFASFVGYLCHATFRVFTCYTFGIFAGLTILLRISVLQMKKKGVKKAEESDQSSSS